MNICPICQKVTPGSMLTLKLEHQIVFHGCLPCWEKMLGNDPIRRALWGFAKKHLSTPVVRPSVEELLAKTDGKFSTEVAVRLLEFAQSTKNPQATLSDLIAEERRAQMRSQVIVGGAANKPPENSTDDPE